MEKREQFIEDEQALDQVLGYLNFSSGNADSKFLRNLNRLWESTVPAGAATPGWQLVGQRLRDRLTAVAGQAGAFQDASQATAVLGLAFDQVVTRYLHFHQDLLFHQSPDAVVTPFLFGRVCEAVLRQGGPWDEPERISQGAIRLLNDFVGYRPLPVLETRRVEPYPHERIRPVPLWIKGVGACVSRYQCVVERAMELLQRVDQSLLRAACFDFSQLDELAFDPRAYDFDHPANKRPNYHFGQWDPHLIDNQGRYRRFVAQQVTLDALMQRLEGELPGPREEIEFEAAAVLAGTILMASGVSGSGPDTYDSNMTLAKLLPRIAAYRDAFYEYLLSCTSGEHAERLRLEAIEKRQPFGGARQHLNAQLARRRASQLEHVQLAGLFARMGYAQEAAEHAQVVPTASARLLCQVDCRLTAAMQAIDQRQLTSAADMLKETMDLIQRGIGCGAIIDPWNILGFDAQFSLFPAAENSVHDHRADELVERMERLFGVYSRVWSEAAAADQDELSERMSSEFHKLANWWRKFAAHEITNVTAIDPLDAYNAAAHVAKALNLWHKGGAATGDISFWSKHAEIFDSPQAYALVIDALLHQRDFVASMGLLMHWLSVADRKPLEQGSSSFHELARRWLSEWCSRGEAARVEPTTGPNHATPAIPEIVVTMTADAWKQVRRFFDSLEANAGIYGEAPQFELGTAKRHEQIQAKDATTGDEPDEGGLFDAAYEGVVFRDSADDGVEGAIFESGGTTNAELTRESERIVDRLVYFGTLASLWRQVALTPIDAADLTQHPTLRVERVAALEHWRESAQHARENLLKLLDNVHSYAVKAPAADHDSMVEYDRHRVVKESLLDQVISVSVDVIEAARLLAAAASAETEPDRLGLRAESSAGDEELLTIQALATLLCRNPMAAQVGIDQLLEVLVHKPLLYVPLAKNGDPRQIVIARARQRSIQMLLKGLPRLGLIIETCQILATAREMERNNPVGPGAVTEFDELFKIGYRAIVECLAVNAECWRAGSEEKESAHSGELVGLLEKLTESLLVDWLAHSRTLRLSVLEKVSDKRAWAKLVEFVERYGGDLFTQRFLNLGNVRAILHQGVSAWLQRLVDDDSRDDRPRLIEELGGAIAHADAAERLTLVLEAIVENYGEYRDYNSTTTQSDRGEMLYSLLDFLRLRAKYDRVCWNLKPVALAHEILVRRGHKHAAQLWRRALRERIGEEADKFQQKLADLQKKYAMQMPSIADRISERFLRPLVIDRLCAFVKPAAEEATRPGSRPNCRLLKVEIETLTREPSGVGFDIPAWLVALEEEVQRATSPTRQHNGLSDLAAAVPYVRLTREQLQRQIHEWTENEKSS